MYRCKKLNHPFINSKEKGLVTLHIINALLLQISKDLDTEDYFYIVSGPLVGFVLSRSGINFHG